MLFPTPISTDAYSRSMIRLFDEQQSIKAALSFMALFGNYGGSDTMFEDDAGSFEIDIVRSSGSDLAAAITRGPGAPRDVKNHTFNGEKFTNVSRQWPLVETEYGINSNQLLLRQAGENPYSGLTRWERNKRIAFKFNRQAVYRHLMTMNYLASQSILTGKMPAIIGTTETSLIYDFKRNTSLNITVDNAWDSVGATILKDIDNACALIESLGNATPDFIAIGSDAMEAFIGDSTVQTMSDNRRFELIDISTNNPVPPELQKYVVAGWIARGRLRTPQGRTLWIFNNNQTYTDQNNVEQRYLPADQAFILDTNARRDALFGPADRMPFSDAEKAWYATMFGVDMDMVPEAVKPEQNSIVDMRMFHFDAYMPDNKKNITLRTQSAGVFVTTQTDAIAVFSGLIDGGE